MEKKVTTMFTIGSAMVLDEDPERSNGLSQLSMAAGSGVEGKWCFEGNLEAVRDALRKAGFKRDRRCIRKMEDALSEAEGAAFVSLRSRGMPK